MKNLVSSKLKHWYIPLILGILFICIGIWSFVTPLETFVTLSIFFSVGFIISGLLEIFYSISNRKTLSNWGWYLASGILTFIVGFQMMVNPALSLLVFSLYIGFWVLFRSVMYISTAFELKAAHQKNWSWVLFFGILGVIFSFILIWNPVITGITLAYWVGFGLISLGIINIIISIGFKKVKNRAEDIKEKIDDYLD